MKKREDKFPVIKKQTDLEIMSVCMLIFQITDTEHVFTKINANEIILMVIFCLFVPRRKK